MADKKIVVVQLSGGNDYLNCGHYAARESALPYATTTIHLQRVYVCVQWRIARCY